MDFIEAIDLKILNSIKMFLHRPIFDEFFCFLTWIGNKGAVWILISIALLYKRKNRKTGITVLIALLLGLILGDIILKPVIGRVRPFIKYDYITTTVENLGIYSFPSGHTTSSLAASITMFMNNKRIGGFLILLALGIAFSRLYLMVHYPSDIIGGMVLGLICAFAADKIVNITNQKIRFKNKLL
jgi:undecaprenyl-diphosphatase